MATKFSITCTNVYGLDFSLKASGNPMRTKVDMSDVTDKDLTRATKLGSCQSGLGHDNFLKGIIVQMNATAPLYWWKQAQRYHWLEFISSQSTMHCLLKFNIEEQCVEETDKVILARMKELVDDYNSCEDNEAKTGKWRTLVASLPCGFCLTASMTTNYAQLKTIYNQRKNHKLKEWHEFCDWARNLPKFVDLTGIE